MRIDSHATITAQPPNNKLHIALFRLAIESILLDAKRGKLRAESFGPSGWYVEWVRHDDECECVLCS